MFGVLRPALGHVSLENKQRYNVIYCNLCAALSAGGAGVFNRFFLVNDVVTIDWLLTDNEQSTQRPFSCKNCLKGGVIGKKKQVLGRQKLLAAISTFMCGVKINDNALDSPKLKNKFMALLYRPIMKKAEGLLRQCHLLDKLQELLILNDQNERQQKTALEEACKPTEHCYSIITQEIAKTYTILPQATIALLGQYFGRCTYLLDAIEDMDADREKNQYNVLNLLSAGKDSPSAKPLVVGTCLEFLKPMRLDITEKLSLLPDSVQFTTLREKCESLFISIENQLLALIKPLNDARLTSLLFSFSNFSGCLTRPNWSVGMDDDTTCGCMRGKGDKCCSGGRPCDLPGA